MFQFRRFPTYDYLIHRTLHGYCPCRLPHSEIHGSMDICSFPWLIAACHVLRRLLMPRHSPCALYSLTNRKLTISRSFSFVNYAGLTDLWNCNCYPHLFRCCSTIKITFTFSVLFSTETSLLPYFTLFSSHCSVFKVRSSSFKARLKRLTLKRFNPISNWLVEISGIEPLTSCLQGRRSPSWAKPPYLFRSGGPKWTRTIDLTIISRVL